MLFCRCFGEVGHAILWMVFRGSQLGANLGHLEPSWSHLGPNVNPAWTNLEPIWLQVGPRLAQVRQLEARSLVQYVPPNDSVGSQRITTRGFQKLGSRSPVLEAFCLSLVCPCWLLLAPSRLKLVPCWLELASRRWAHMASKDLPVPHI